MCHISGPSDKSLLLQTVALFETLLSKIKQLQNENAKLKTEQQDLYNSNALSVENMNKIHSDRDQLVLELEESRNKLNNANKVCYISLIIRGIRLLLSTSAKIC